MKAPETSSGSGTLWQTLKRPPWRTLVPAVSLLLLVLVARALWSPGRDFTDGRHDFGRNGVWMQHGWIGADSWFIENERQHKLPLFRSVQKVREMTSLMKRNGVRDIFPHLCPTTPKGEIMPVDDRQTEVLLREAGNIRVLPWVGGVLDADVSPDIASRRQTFTRSIRALLLRHPKLAGVHLNVEPWPSGNKNMLVLLDEIRQALPPGKLLSVAAYPPPTRWHPFPEVHWEEDYFKQVASRVDQMAVMMYDTALKDPKLYQHLMRGWTQQILDWSAQAKRPPEILLGVPTYDDAGVGYHNPDVENLPFALMGIHAGLASYPKPPAHYAGAAVYCEWETDEAEWKYWREHFRRP